jgi:hypothetical protein
VAAYLLAALASTYVGWRERAVPVSERDEGQWPVFMFLTAAVLLVMAVGVSGHVDDWIADIGRQRARADGWYDQRRSLQAAVVVGVGAIWFVVTALAIWRVPERRRRYLPLALVVFTLMCFAGVRVVSLHQIDAALHQRRFLGAEIGFTVEMLLLALVLVTACWHPFGRRVGQTRAFA